MNLCNFEPWCGAVDTYNTIKDGGMLDELETRLKQMYPDGLTMTELNDELWFGGQDWLRVLGFRTMDQVEEELNKAREELDKLNLAYKEEVKGLASGDSTGRDFRDELGELYLRGYLDDIKDVEARISELESELEGM